MKVDRKTKSAINRRANWVALALVNLFATRMKAQIEADEIAGADIAHWWPEEFDADAIHQARVGAVAEAVTVAADVCGYCDTVLPGGCGGQFRENMACELRKRRAGARPIWKGQGEIPRWQAPDDSDSAVDLLDPLDAF